MPRPKSLPDAQVLDVAHRLIQDYGPQALTFESVAKACGLSASTLVQRFGTKAGLMQSALLRAWDKLDERTAELAATVPRSPDGAVRLLAELSKSYGGIESYAEGLLVLREDLRDPALRARGTRWKAALSAALEDRFAGIAGAPEGIGLMMAAQWQGALLWWGFDPRGDLAAFVEENLERFVSAVLPGRPGTSHVAG